MIQVALIGGGSLAFTRRLMTDILAVPELRDTQFRLMDIDPERLDMMTRLCRKFIEDNNLSAAVDSTLNQREALVDADYVVSSVRVGGLEAFAHDIEIPLKYGVDQCVGDTLGPGGVFYALRTIPVLLDIAADMREVAPDALLMNYSNPMAMNCWALRRAGGVSPVGLCHAVPHSHSKIAEALGLPKEEIDFVAAGINHMTWFIRVTHQGRDMVPYLLEAFENHPRLSEIEPLRIDVMRRFGYFCTESNGHLSEYLPWYRKRPGEMERWISHDSWIGGETGGYLRHCRERADEYKELFPKLMTGELDVATLGERTVEHVSYIIESIETGRPYLGYLNVGNYGLIPNLPYGCTVEIPCWVDGNGISTTWTGPLPMQCAAACRSNVNAQEMAVEAALTGDRDLVKLAILHDPLTGAVCAPDEVWAMCDEMFEALAPWLPQFNGEGRTWPDMALPNGGVLHFSGSSADPN